MLTVRPGQTVVIDVESFPLESDCADPPLVSIGLHGLYPLPWVTIITHTSMMHIVDPAIGTEGDYALSPRSASVHWTLEQGAIQAYVDDLLPHCNFITHRGAFDFAVLAAAFPDLWHKVLDTVERQGVYDTRIAEARLLGVNRPEYATLNAHHKALKENPGFNGKHGECEWKAQFPCRGKSLYLDALAKRYGGKGLPGLQCGATFDTLRDVPLNKWPADAVRYCIGDLLATGYIQTRQVVRFFDERDEQEDAMDDGPDAWEQGLITSEVFQLHLDFCQDVRDGKAIAWRDKAP